MGMAARMFTEACKVTKPKPVKFALTDKDGEEITTSYTTNGVPRDYSEAEIKRVANVAGIKISGSKKLSTGVPLTMPRTDATGAGAESLIGLVFGNEAPELHDKRTPAEKEASERAQLAAAQLAAELAQLERETAPAA
jgi:hypothetical protein